MSDSTEALQNARILMQAANDTMLPGVQTIGVAAAQAWALIDIAESLRIIASRMDVQ